MAKYEITDETLTMPDGRTLYRIKALMAIEPCKVKPGDLGGWIEGMHNLEQYGDAWIYDNARVFDKAIVYGSAWVFNNAEVYGNARINGKAEISGNARVYGNACVLESAWVTGDAIVCGNTIIYGDMHITGNSIVLDNEFSKDCGFIPVANSNRISI